MPHFVAQITQDVFRIDSFDKSTFALLDFSQLLISEIERNTNRNRAIRNPPFIRQIKLRLQPGYAASYQFLIKFGDDGFKRTSHNLKFEITDSPIQNFGRNLLRKPSFE